MDYVENLLELAIEEDSIEEYKERLNEIALQESLLSKIGLEKKDLQDPNKVKSAIKNMNGITSEYEKRSTYVSIISSLLQTISSLISLTEWSPKGKAVSIISNFIIQLITSIANYHLGVSDYRKLLAKIDNEIKKTTNKIAKLKDDYSENGKEKIKELEKVRENLRKSKDVIIDRMRKENAIEGHPNKKINPEPKSPMAAFTGMI